MTVPVTRHLATPGDGRQRSGPPGIEGARGSNPLSSTKFSQVTSSQYGPGFQVGSQAGSRREKSRARRTGALQMIMEYQSAADHGGTALSQLATTSAEGPAGPQGCRPGASHRSAPGVPGDCGSGLPGWAGTGPGQRVLLGPVTSGCLAVVRWLRPAERAEAWCSGASSWSFGFKIARRTSRGRARSWPSWATAPAGPVIAPRRQARPAARIWSPGGVTRASYVCETPLSRGPVKRLPDSAPDTGGR
jgi:hypothetical protein